MTSNRERAARAFARSNRRAEARRLEWAQRMCATCAYRPDTEAAREDGDPGLTRARLALLDACMPFYCHEPPPGEPAVVKPRLKLCIGHARAIRARFKDGHVPTEEERAIAFLAVRELNCARAVTPPMSGGFPVIFAKVAVLALARGVAGINRLPGCWVDDVDEHWTVAVNAHAEAIAAEPEGAMRAEVPPYAVAVWWHGWLAGIVNAGGGVIAAHAEGASEDRLIADLDAAIARAGKVQES